MVDASDLSFWRDDDRALLGAVETDHDGERTVLLCRAASASLFVLDQLQSQRPGQVRTLSAGAGGLELDERDSGSTEARPSQGPGCPACAMTAELVQRRSVEVEQQRAQLELLSSELRVHEGQLEDQAAELSERQARLVALEVGAEERQAHLLSQSLELQARLMQVEGSEAEADKCGGLLAAERQAVEQRSMQQGAERAALDAERSAFELSKAQQLTEWAARESDATCRVAAALAAAEAREAEAALMTAAAAAAVAAAEEMAAVVARSIAEAVAAAAAAERRELCAQQLQAALGVEVAAFMEAKEAEARLAAQRKAALDPELIFETGWFGRVKGQQQLQPMSLST